MESLSISGNYFFNAHLTLDMDQMKGCEKQQTRLPELGLIEAFIDKWFTHGNKEKAIVAFNTLLDPDKTTAEKDKAVGTLQGLMPEGHRNDIAGARSSSDFGRFTLTINQEEITCLSNYKEINDIKQSLSTVGLALVNLKPTVIGKDFLYDLAQNKDSDLTKIRAILPVLLATKPQHCDLKMENGYTLGSCDSKINQFALEIAEARFGDEPFHRWESKALTLTDQTKTARLQIRLEHNIQSHLNKIGEKCLLLSQHLEVNYPQPKPLPPLSTDV
ncbi:hypothetical protein [Shewanella surugensis]|uniref:Uncharacterized protein n=1 Tax=Shewanella surugensis TaxID=212020 RepID=A0ABT0LJ07_9GAMM|nr:hypothetical protein [Shewanella surugensis]MCL1127440.1 hypothetical protein [Shewanella surugensis]